MNKQKSTGISYCDYTSNPITGCLHDCFYCWARDMCDRFHRSFKPAFHPEELLAYDKLRGRQRIFVCDASDMWGKWIPDLWIELVLTANRCSDHRFLYLTKNPERYIGAWDYPDLTMIGTSMTGADKASLKRLDCLIEAPHDRDDVLRWVSLEPLISDTHGINFEGVDWVVIGAMTGRCRSKYPCKDIWVEQAIEQARRAGAKVYIKGNLVKKYPVRELPW